MILRKAILIAGHDFSVKAHEEGIKNGVHINKLMTADIERMSFFLSKAIAGKWEPQEIHLLPDHDMKENNLREQIEQILPSAADFVFFYYTGHGSRDANNYPCMQFLTGPAGNIAEDLFVEELKIILGEKKVKNYLLIINACRTSAPIQQAKIGLPSVYLEWFDDFAGNMGEYKKVMDSLNNENAVVYTTRDGKAALYNNHGNLFTECFYDSIYQLVRVRNDGRYLTISEVIDKTNQVMTQYYYDQQAEVIKIGGDEPSLIPVVFSGGMTAI